MSDREKAIKIAITVCDDFEIESYAHIVDASGNKITVEDGISMAIETALRTAREEGRRDGLEEAAKIAEDHKNNKNCYGPCYDDEGWVVCNESIANAIRSQKEVG